MKNSIITATYNSGETVRDTLNSVLRQTYQDYELIVKDGGALTCIEKAWCLFQLCDGGY